MKNALFLLIVSGLLIVRCSKNDETPTPTSAAESKSSYLPLTAGSTWEYDSALKYSVEMTGVQKTFDGKSYFEGKTTRASGVSLGYARIENGTYYNRGLLAGAETELIILKDNVPVGTQWETNLTINTVPTKYKFTVDKKDISYTASGKTFDKVIKVKMDASITYAGLTYPFSTQYLYFAYGVGIIQTDSDLVGKVNLVSYTIK
jgi:hypothetical protein